MPVWDTLESIRSGSVYFARREKLNDPFDCTSVFRVDIENGDINEFLIQAGASNALSRPIEEKKDIMLNVSAIDPTHVTRAFERFFLSQRVVFTVRVEVAEEVIVLPTSSRGGDR